MTEKIALFDMDGTLADYDKQLHEDMERLRGPEEPTSTHRELMPQHLVNRMKLIKSQKDWWFNLPKIEAGFRVLSIAKEIGFKIHILTKGPTTTPQAWTEKVLWCQKNIGSDVDITIAQDKGLVYGRVLVDDFPDYMERWLKYRPRGLGIMPLANYNKDFKHTNIIKYDGIDFSEVEARLKLAFNRTG